MKTYAVMKEDGAGDVLPGAFHPLCNPSNILPDPVALNSPFVSGLLRNEAGTDAGTVYAKGSLAFICPQGSDERYVVNGTQGIQSLLLYDAWAETHLTDPDLVTLFEKAWSLYPEGFYWVPAIHPYCVLRSKEEPLKLIHAPVDSSSSSTPALRLCLCVQRYAAPASFAEVLTFGLKITGSVETSLGYSAGVMDVILFTLNTAYSVRTNGFYFGVFPSIWSDGQLGTITNSLTGATDTAALAGTFTLSKGYTDPALGTTVTWGYIAMTTSDIATLRTEVWPAGGATTLMAWTNSSEGLITDHLVSAHGLTEAQASGLFPEPTPTTGAYLPGLYTGTTGGVARNMIVFGVGHNRDYGTAISLEYTDGANPRIVEEADLTSFSFLFDASKQAHWATIGGSGSSGTVWQQRAVLTSPALPGTAVSNLTTVDASARRVIYASVSGQMLAGLDVTLVLTTGTASYFTDAAKVGIRVEGVEYFSFDALPDGIEYYDYDTDASILWLKIDAEKLGMPTTTDGNGVKTFKPLQSITVSFNIPGGSSSAIMDVLRLMETTGSFIGGGTYDDGGSTETPSFLSSWDRFTSAEDLAKE